MQRSIFVQIASYRDPLLVPTLLDAIAQAKDPAALHFCVAWQHGPEESEEIFRGLPRDVRLTLIDIPHQESKGACWARNLIQERYAGEEFTLQLDSHHRFEKGWDALCIEMIEQLQADGIEKPLLTAYLPSFDPEQDPQQRGADPWKMDFDRFTPEGATLFMPSHIEDWRERRSPLPARFFSAHFAFASGKLCEEVPHDPDLYFHGEEITLAARAFTHGYDLFHPHRTVAWHEYTRRGRSKHWDDHDYSRANAASLERVRMLLGMDEFAAPAARAGSVHEGRYGFGKRRSLELYERYAGICFSERAVTRELLDRQAPSSADNRLIDYDVFKERCVPIFRHCINVPLESVPLADYDFWVVSFQDASGDEMYREDAKRDEIERLCAVEHPRGEIWREFVTRVIPSSWMVWPHSASLGWCAPLSGKIWTGHCRRS